MNILSQTYNSVSGSTYVQAGELRFVIPLKVCREGIQYDVVTTGNPGNRQVGYNSSNGRFTFLNPFVSVPGGPSLTPSGGSPLMIPEKVYIEYKI
jgi:hypothetical protein